MWTSNDDKICTHLPAMPWLGSHCSSVCRNEGSKLETRKWNNSCISAGSRPLLKHQLIESKTQQKTRTKLILFGIHDIREWGEMIEKHIPSQRDWNMSTHKRNMSIYYKYLKLYLTLRFNMYWEVKILHWGLTCIERWRTRSSLIKVYEYVKSELLICFYFKNKFIYKFQG
jgi:hypothetical protein